MLKAEESEMAFLTDAAKSCAGQPLNTKMKVLSQAFLTHRQMGESEAYYRLFPHMHLTESNVKCVFVSTGFPSKRLSFFSKVSDSEKHLLQEDDGDDPDAEPHQRQSKTKNTISIENRKGQFTEAIQIQQKYAARPINLNQMCLAQFATLYDSIPAKQIQCVRFEDDISCQRSKTMIVTPSHATNTFLPMYIKLANNLGFMKLRTFPSVLRLHKFNKTTNAHEFFYSELMLYRPWRNEAELFESDLVSCIELYNELPENSPDPKIQIVKKKLFPHMANVEEARAMLDSLPSTRLQHIADTIDPETQQENDDQLEEGISLSDEYAIREPSENMLRIDDTNNINIDKTMFKRVDLTNLDNLYKSARELVPEQRIPFNMMMAFCKTLRKSLSFNTLKPKPPLLKIHGGAGSGKSKLLEVITMWVEYFLRLPDDRHPDQPIVIRAAPTGKAASNIDGLTMHTAFR